MKQYKAIWEKDVLPYTSIDALKNSDILANRLGKDIKIIKGELRGCIGPTKLYRYLRNDVNYYDAKTSADNNKLFVKADGSVDFKAITQFNLLKDILKQYYGEIADHPITLLSNNKIIGIGWSPYINTTQDDELLCATIKNHLIQCLDLMSPNLKNKYDIIVLSPKETIYSVDKTITILFLKS